MRQCNFSAFPCAGFPLRLLWVLSVSYTHLDVYKRQDVDSMLEQIDENTIVVVPTFGVTYTGAYELPADCLLYTSRCV